MHYLKKLAVRGGAFVLAVSVPLSTMAQIEEIVVTAQRREASAQDTPIAINSLSGDQLDDYGVIGADDLEQSFVGITTNNSGPVNAGLSIRGVGTSSFHVSTQQSVAVYIDNIYQISPFTSAIGRVARRIWARAMRERYRANARSQMLKYHIQTSGRSLHAQEISFNDIRTTLQALYALFDNCNSLHTNAFDEAITTPTEHSVRRAVAIQLIIARELGLNYCENALQGSFIVDELTDLVEEAVYKEFERISERGGVLGAMDRMYQRGRIQDESLYYESRKHDGSFPIVGVNTFLPEAGQEDESRGRELIRSTEEEKQAQIRNVRAFQAAHADSSAKALESLQRIARARGNVFKELMETVRCSSLGQISHALYAVGGEYRRNM